ncbi:hypothetical protein BDV11DRAFT_174628 [Aspergillus similis]
MTDRSSPCVSGSWTPAQQEKCFYTSHVKLFYAASKRGIWSLGSDVIMKDRPDEGPNTKVTTLKYLVNHHDDKSLADSKRTLKWSATDLGILGIALCFSG